MPQLLQRLPARSFAVLLTGAMATAAVAYVDLVTGELRLTTFYVAIVFGVAWFADRPSGLAIGTIGLAAIVWANPPMRHLDLEGVYWLIDVLGTSAMLLTSAHLAARLRASLDTERRERLNLSRYLPRAVADLLARDGLEAMRARRLHAAILFMDIRGFTALVQTIAPAALFDNLQAYRALISPIIESEGGLVDKFIGDGVLAAFGTLAPAPTDAASAIRCAIRLLEAIAASNDARVARGEPPLRVGIGVHYGEVVVGAIGDEHRLEYTLLGHAVNIASRIEQLTKKHGIPLLVSEDALTAAVAGGLSPESWGRLAESDVPGVSGVLRLASPPPFLVATGPCGLAGE